MKAGRKEAIAGSSGDLQEIGPISPRDSRAK